MGGNALKTVKTQRLSAAAYHPFAARVAGRIATSWPLARPYIIPAYAAKPDFGDLNLLVDGAGMPATAAEDLAAMFASREVVRNGPVTSLEVDGFQVDVVRVPTEIYPCASIYFAYNDAGNLMGRVARALGFKFGFEGLSYLLRDGDHLLAEIFVSRDPRAILEFLGYDYEAFVYGFQTLEEMFAFIASSPLFDPTRYALEGRNHTARVRDRKRASYRAFLQWLDTHAPPPGSMAGQDRTSYLERAGRHFPRFPGDLADAALQHARRQLRRTRFNGDLVAAVTGLSGRQLGALIQEVQTGFPGGRAAFEAWLDTDPGEVAVREAITAGVARIGAGRQSASSTAGPTA